MYRPIEFTEEACRVSLSRKLYFQKDRFADETSYKRAGGNAPENRRMRCNGKSFNQQQASCLPFCNRSGVSAAL
jgi:hypothetical protein